MLTTIIMYQINNTNLIIIIIIIIIFTEECGRVIVVGGNLKNPSRPYFMDQLNL